MKCHYTATTMAQVRTHTRQSAGEDLKKYKLLCTVGSRAKVVAALENNRDVSFIVKHTLIV